MSFTFEVAVVEFRCIGTVVLRLVILLAKYGFAMQATDKMNFKFAECLSILVLSYRASDWW